MVDLRARLRRDETVVGSWIHTGSPVVAELMAAAGFDFLAVDVEHGPIDVPQALALFQAIRAGRPACAPLVRLADHRYATTKRFMDAGAMGVIAPLVNHPEQARELVSAVKYPPEGSRGVGYARSNVFGTDLAAAVRGANAQTMVCIQIEHVDGVERIDEILRVPGVDAAFIGPYDLSASMGVTGQLDHPEVVRAMERILRACRTAEVAPGIHVVRPDVGELTRRIREGYRFVAYSLDITLIAHGCAEALEAIRGTAPGRREA